MGSEQKQLSPTRWEKPATTTPDEPTTQPSIKGISKKLETNQCAVIQKDLKQVTAVQSSVSSRLKINFQAIETPAKLAGRLKYYLTNWQQITHDPDILGAVQGYKFELLATPHQVRKCQTLHFPTRDAELIDSEIQKKTGH